MIRRILAVVAIVLGVLVGWLSPSTGEAMEPIGTTFITEVAKDSQGNLYNKVLRKIDNVNQTLGAPPAEFKVGSRDEPNCP